MTPIIAPTRMVCRQRLVFAVSVLMTACGATATPLEQFCDQAVPLLSQTPDLGELEPGVGEQMEELGLLSELLPEDQEEQLIALIHDLSQSFQSSEGWSSRDVVEYVGTLCGRDLPWSLVTP